MMNLVFLLLIAYLGCSLATPNSAIVVKDATGKVCDSLSIYKRPSVYRLSCSLQRLGIDWSIAPEIQGVTMKGSSIQLNATEVLPKTVFTITASDNGQTISRTFEIEIRACEYGSVTHIQKGSSDAYFQLYRDTKLMYNGTFDDEYFCLPRGTYRYTSDECEEGHNLFITDEGGGLLHRNYFNGHARFEGSFTNVLDGPISFDFPSVVSLIPGSKKAFYISTFGHVKYWKIEPMDLIQFHEKEYRFYITDCTAGTATYTITAWRNDTSAQKTFTVYCGFCPKDTTMVTAEPDNLQASFALPEAEGDRTSSGKQSYCVPSSAFTLVYQTSKGVPLTLSKEGHVFYEYYPVASDSIYAELHVEWATPVAFATPIPFFTGSPKKKWNQVGFNAKGWQQGSEGNWSPSARSANTVFFRAPFTLDAEVGFTNVMVFLRGKGSAEVFINGVSFGTATLRADSNAIAIPVSYAVSGNNVVAVRLTKDPSTIVFGLSVELSNAPFLRLNEGVASNIQAIPDTNHPPADAFGSDEYYSVYWLARSYPAELIFTFNAPQVVNKVRFILNPLWSAFSLKLVGVTGSEKVELAAWNKDYIVGASTNGKSSMLSYINNRAFQAYHFVVQSSSANDTQLTGIRMYHDAQFVCPKKWGFKNVVEGTTVFKRCPLGYTGRRARSCVHQGMGAQWEDSKAQCFGTNPPKDFAYVDLEFTLTNVTGTFWGESGREAFVGLLVEKTYLRAEDVNLLYTDFVVDGEKMTVKVFARCTVMSLMGRAIEYNLDSLTPKFAELVAAKLGEGCGGSIDKVKLHQYVNWAMVIIVSVVVVVGAVVIGAYTYTRNKSGRVKTLHKRANNDETLLVLGVC